MLSDIVDPFLFGSAGLGSPASTELKEYLQTHSPKTTLHDSIQSLVDPANGHTMAIISSRTSDMPGLFNEIIDAGVSNVYLEKPGATTVTELEEMVETAKSREINVAMGYNKNVASYITEARDVEAANTGSETTFIHMNAVPREELGECFERNSEGMLKNQMIHELALMCTYYGVAVDTIAEVIPNEEATTYETIQGPSGTRHYTIIND